MEKNKTNTRKTRKLEKHKKIDTKRQKHKKTKITKTRKHTKNHNFSKSRFRFINFIRSKHHTTTYFRVSTNKYIIISKAQKSIATVIHAAISGYDALTLERLHRNYTQ